MRLPPVSVLEEWPSPNYVDPVLRGPANITIIAIFFPLALLVVGIRIYTRIRLSKSFGIDDWFILATLVGRLVMRSNKFIADDVKVPCNRIRSTGFALRSLLWME